MKPVEEIVVAWQNRRTERGPFFERCNTIAQHYDNDVPLPMPELSAKEAPAVANLISQGIDQHATRIASQLPDIQSIAVKHGVQTSEDRAVLRRRVCVGWWETNSYELLMRQRARWLVAYAQSPVKIIPSKELRHPKWVLRSPLETYPGFMDHGQMQPEDCIFAVTRTVSWVRQHYPDVPVNSIVVQTGTYTKSRPLNDTDEIEIIEWVDSEETTVICLGPGEQDMPRQAEYGIQDAQIINLGPVGGPGQPGKWAALLFTTPNRSDGMCPVVVPGRISLNYPKGQFDDTTGLYQMQAKLMAMEVNAVANGIWPDQWLISNGQDTPQIITPADGRKGIVGLARGGTWSTQQIQPGLQTPTTIDRLERGIRQNGGIPADFGGESASNIRTGRRGDAVLSAAVDFTIEEHHQILARSAQTELQIAATLDLNWYRNEKKTFYVSWKGAQGRLDYTPKDIWTEDRTIRVSYAKAGADVNQLTVEIGQLSSLGVMSKKTAGRMHPDVKDPEFEHGQVLYESLEAAALASLQQAASTGATALPDVARIGQLVDTGMNLFDAVTKAHDEAQQRQSSTVSPAEPGSPEAQPGLAPPGAGAEAGTPAVGPPSPSVANLSMLLRNLRTPGQIAAQGTPA